MTDKILEMAKEANFNVSEGEIIVGDYGNYYEITNQLEAFANLIRADERINCIKIIGKELGLTDEYVAEYLSKRGE